MTRPSKTTLLLILAAAAWIAWFALALETQHRRSQLLVPADYQRCIKINPGPLAPPPRRLPGRGPVTEIA